MELARDLRVSPKMVRHWEAAGVLQRRAGRITHESLELFLRKCGSEINSMLSMRKCSSGLKTVRVSFQQMHV